MSPRRKRSPEEQRELTPLEEDVMRGLWQCGECTSAEIIEVFRREHRDLAETTIRTVLSNLREKGYVTVTRASGRHFLYRAEVSRDSVARAALRDYVKRLTDGSPSQAIAYLIEDSNISEQELEELRGLLEARRKGRKA